MKKNDLILILAVLAAALLLLGLSFYARAQRVNAQPPAPEESAADESWPASVREAAAAYFEEYPAESYLIVRSPSGLYAPIPLNEDNSFRIRQENGDENVVHIGKNSFYMESSNCENQNCIGQGEVTLENRETRVLFNMVICLPHGISLELLTREEAYALLLETYAAEQAQAAG